MEDDARHAHMCRIVDGIESLALEAAQQFTQLAEETRGDRRAAEVALTQWQATSGWTQHELARDYPVAAAYVEHVLEAARPRGFSFTARTAVVDALRCILIADLSPRPGLGIDRVLCGPVNDVLGLALPAESS